MGANQSRSRRKSNNKACCGDEDCCANVMTGPIIMGFLVTMAALAIACMGFAEVLQRRIMGVTGWTNLTWAIVAGTTSAMIIFAVLSALGHRVGGIVNPHGSNYHPYFLLFGTAWTMSVFTIAGLYRFKYLYPQDDLDTFDKSDWTLWNPTMVAAWTGIQLLQVVLGLITSMLWFNTIDKELHPTVVMNSGTNEATALRGVETNGT